MARKQFQIIVLGMLLLLSRGISADTNAEQLSGTLKKIKDSGIVRVGHRVASVPFAYLNSEGQPVGYSMELCNRIIDRIKTTLDLPRLETKLVPVNAQTRIPLLVDGSIDIECGSTTNNLTRSQMIDYLSITFITGTKLLVKKNSGIRKIEDMVGKRIAVPMGSTNERLIQRIVVQQGIEIHIQPVQDHPEAWEALSTGKVDAYANDDVLSYGLISRSPTPEDYEVVGPFLSYDPYSLMIRRDDSAMRLLGNTVLSDLMRTGEMEKIYRKWFDPGPTQINMPISNILRYAFQIQALPY